MNKKLILLSFSALLLGACSTGNNADETPTEEPETSMEETSSMTEDSESMEEDSESAENEDEDMESEEEDHDPVSEDDLKDAKEVSEYSDYEELDKQDVFEPEDYDGHLVTDNQGTRVFIFKKGNEQAYKTIFVKHDNRLKVIDLKKDDLVFNEVLK